MKVTRLLIYEGPEEWLEKQLGLSLPDGTRKMPTGTFTVTTLPTAWTWRHLWRALRGKVHWALTDEVKRYGIRRTEFPQ